MTERFSGRETMAGRRYAGPAELPDIVPVFPLSGALLLPRGQLPLNIFEPRYLAMVDAALAADRLIGMVQPRAEAPENAWAPPLEAVGGLGRITAFVDVGDGRYRITLTGVTRFRSLGEVATDRPFRLCRISAVDFAGDFVALAGDDAVDRAQLLRTFRAYLDAHSLQADWDSIKRAPNETLVNALSMISPFGPAEKQALLEAPDLRARAETLVAIAEFDLARRGGGEGAPPTLN